MKCLLGILTMVAIVGAQVPPGHGYEIVTVTNGGAVEGKVEFTGPKPPARKVVPTKDTAVCGGAREVEQIQLSPDKGVGDAVVWVKRVEKGKAWDKPATPRRSGTPTAISSRTFRSCSSAPTSSSSTRMRSSTTSTRSSAR